MDDARLVRGAEALEDVVDDGADLAEGEVLLALEAIGEGLAAELLEDEEVGAVGGRAHLDELADVRALDGGGDAGLALEAADEIRLEGGARQQHLDGHVGAARRRSRGGPHR